MAGNSDYLHLNNASTLKFYKVKRKKKYTTVGTIEKHYRK
jgi:hypothetical protein